MGFWIGGLALSSIGSLLALPLAMSILDGKAYVECLPTARKGIRAENCSSDYLVTPSQGRVLHGVQY